MRKARSAKGRARRVLITGGNGFIASYLRYLIGRYHEVEAALAAYNAGPGNADVWADQGGDIRTAIDIPATRHYVVKVVRAREAYRRLYPRTFQWNGSR